MHEAADMLAEVAREVPMLPGEFERPAGARIGADRARARGQLADRALPARPHTVRGEAAR
ncbi:MAG: hypothetical protein KatS3mg120_0188 [Erythrobacter sp.]|nr:MAG: hypothetical protein KatS3mg120_0188 [Erythrobacter sp.]